MLINTGLKGDRMPYVPDLTWSATADYYLPLTGDWGMNVGGGYRFVDDRITETTQRQSSTSAARWKCIDHHARPEHRQLPGARPVPVGLQRELVDPRLHEERLRRARLLDDGRHHQPGHQGDAPHGGDADHAAHVRARGRLPLLIHPTSTNLVNTAAMTTIALPQPYLLFLGDTTEPGYAKTAFGLRDWAPERCIGEFSVPGATVTTGLPFLTPAQAHAAGAQAMVIGVANAGGFIPPAWLDALVEAMEAGLDLIGGMHARLRDFPRLRETAERHGRRLIDIRIPPERIPVATGKARTGRRLLTIGTDCALGKKYTALSLARAFQSRGVDATFRATGQTGILIAGGGIPMDAVVADFAAGAAELLTPDAAPTHWDVIEGQGSLHHPAYAGVSLALLHGSQPDVIVVCHEPGRDRVLGHPDYPVPGLRETIELALRLGARTSPRIRCAGISLNTGKLDAEEAARVIASESERLGLPVADPIRGGEAFDRLVASCLA